jgi:hypothetical protein
MEKASGIRYDVPQASELCGLGTNLKRKTEVLRFISAAIEHIIGKRF